MKKVGIITSYLDFNKNYGGILQAYALSEIVSNMGYDAYIMPYVYEYISEREKAESSFHKFARKIRKQYKVLISDAFRYQEQNYKNIFAFVNATLPLFQKDRMRVTELEILSKDFYAFISGSDQVWSTKLQQESCDPGMFLKFVPDGVKRIAYAPSLGSTVSMSAKTAVDFRDSVLRYDAISVRERQGQQLIKEITGLDVPIVLDPTLLLPVHKWIDFCETPPDLPEHYILLYRFGKELNPYLQEIQQKVGLPIIELPSSELSMHDGYDKRFDINPAQFLGIIKNAELVLTDSFHCTVFSILLKSQFLTFYRQSPSNKSNMNGRVDDLLGMTELTSRLISPNAAVNYDKISEAQFNLAHANIELHREFSYQYLTNSLQ